MGNCSGHWNNWNKDEKGKFESRDHKSKFNKGCFDDHKHDHKHDHKCDCDSCCGQPKHKHKDDCVVVDKVICSKEVQKIAESRSGFGVGFGGSTDVNIDVTVHEDSIDQNIVVIKDKIVNIGVVPVTIIVRPTSGGSGSITIQDILRFQEHTDCPGVCPEDTVTETPLQVEAVIAQAIQTGSISGTPIFAIVVKVILRTRITATRQVVKSKDGCLIDVNENRCEARIPSIIQPPTLLRGQTAFPRVLSTDNAILLTENETLNSSIPQRNETE